MSTTERVIPPVPTTTPTPRKGKLDTDTTAQKNKSYILASV